MPAAFPPVRSPLALRRPALSITLAVALAASLMATATQAAAAAPSCSSPDPIRAIGVARADRSDGASEVTQFDAAGGYQVTRCAKGGRVLVSQTVAPIRDPDGGLTLVPTETEAPGVRIAALYGDSSEPGWAAAFRASRAGIRATMMQPTTPRSAATPVSAPAGAGAAQPEAVDPATATGVAGAAATDACTNSQYTLWQGAWASRSYAYRINRSKFNYNDTTVASIVDGHTNWDTTYNGCGLNDITNLTSTYLGSTSAGIHTVPDGQSVTDRGDLAAVGCAGALACTWLFTDAAGNATETDQRFSDDFTFSNVGAAGAYDFESVATHESGHGIGLGHASSSNALTMYPSISAGSTAARTLAKGDVMGLRARYP
jgi:hypothetical protein